MQCIHLAADASTILHTASRVWAYLRPKAAAEVGGGMVEEVRWTKQGAFLMTKKDAAYTPEDVQARRSEIETFAVPTEHDENRRIVEFSSLAERRSKL